MLADLLFESVDAFDYECCHVKKCCTLWRGRPSQTMTALAEPDLGVICAVSMQKKSHESRIKNEVEDAIAEDEI